jgi:undecaprenyl-diphosphatase
LYSGDIHAGEQRTADRARPHDRGAIQAWILNQEAFMQLAFWQILVLAVAQGLTEFLPISSSGHLVILTALMGSGDPQQLDVADVSVVLHVGTLFSILVFYAHHIWRLLGEDRRAIRLLIVGTIPAVVVGLSIELTCKHLIENTLLAGVMLVVTGLILLWAARSLSGVTLYTEMSYRQALVIGLSQAAAILPGLSRSGTTISVGLKQGLSPRSAATFSFLLAIPAIAGAGVLKTIGMVTKTGLQTPWPHLLIGGVVSFLVGLWAISWLINWLERGRLRLFAWWCIPLGVMVTIWQLWVFWT